MPSLMEARGEELKSKRTQRLQSSLGTVWSGEVRRDVGKALRRNGPAVGPCEISAAMKELIALAKQTAEEWLDLEGVGKELER